MASEESPNSLELRFGRLGFGAAGIGNLYRNVPDDDARATLEAAWDGGIRYFDTAPHYGLGLSERRVGEFLRSKPREEFLISTKVGKLLRPNPEFSGQPDDEGFAVPAEFRRQWAPDEAGIRASLEDSLERLGLDSIDILYLHDPDVYNLEEGISQALPALEKLRAEGLVKAIGVGANSSEALLACVERADLDLIMLAGRYTLLEQPALADLLPACLERGVGVVNVGVFNSGLLASSTIRDDAHYNYQPAPEAVLEHARRLSALCREYDVELPAAAIQFSLHHPAVETVVVGARTAAQIQQNIESMNARIPQGLWAALAREGLVPA
ncbi:D-threo-aldose 1-dehydrogenase [Arthrobacter pigmenti]|uniref:D-threo-aldose 1-dehydrogenase n=1 Tax=Arthrobacter pigmenti TaxID=271432 RepID=A0A846RM77_9MICC|nr:aldo/keto reductase [Arthrobacter pigmenti]NJC20935.1 D-threo-aldose 1-dehydrogenase [Arthrobacter pigmenti]